MHVRAALTNGLSGTRSRSCCSSAPSTAGCLKPTLRSASPNGSSPTSTPEVLPSHPPLRMMFVSRRSRFAGRHPSHSAGDVSPAPLICRPPKALARAKGTSSMTAAFLYAAARTPFGKFGGALRRGPPDDLAATALQGVLDKAPDLDPSEIGDVVWGNANGAGEDNRNVGRMAVLLAGLPVTVPATTVNRLCGSSLDAAMMASRTIETGRRRRGGGRRGGVDDPGPVGAAQAVAGLPRRRRHRRRRPRWAGGW